LHSLEFSEVTKAPVEFAGAVMYIEIPHNDHSRSLFSTIILTFANKYVTYNNLI
jgi:hypothetical protein